MKTKLQNKIKNIMKRENWKEIDEEYFNLVKKCADNKINCRIPSYK